MSVMDSIHSAEGPSAAVAGNNDGDMKINKLHPSPGNNEESDGQRNRSTKRHYHDAFGEADSGVDYGPPIELEDVEPDDSIEEPDENDQSKVKDNNGSEDFNPTSKSNYEDVDEEGATAITLEELEETVGLHEATLESLHDKLSKLNEEIKMEEQTSTSLQNDVETLKKKKIVLKKRTENNVQLVKELEESLEKCLDRLRRAMDMGEDEYVDVGTMDSEEEEKINDDLQLHQDGDQPPNENNTVASNLAQDLKKRDFGNFDIIRMQISMKEVTGIAWPQHRSKLAKEVRKKADSLPFVFPIWRTSVFRCAFYTQLDSPGLLLHMMNTIVLENLLCREQLKVDGCGQVHVSRIWGTSLDIMKQVTWSNQNPSFTREISTASVESECIDPNVQLCPYELGGTCADDRCPYQHLSKTKQSKNGRKLLSLDDNFIKYHSLPKLALPPSPFSEGNASEEESTDANDVDLKRSTAVEEKEMKSIPESSNVQCFVQNDDYISLPTAAETIDTQVVGNRESSGDLEFCERFWWYREQPFDTSLNAHESPRDVFTNVLISFGLRRNAQNVEFISPTRSWDQSKEELERNELVVNARMIDMCRVCIHLGEGPFVLATLDSWQKKPCAKLFRQTIKSARRQVEVSMGCNSSQIMFDTQLFLLLFSRYISAQYYKHDMQFSLQGVLDIISGQKNKKWKDLFESIVSRSPKRRKTTTQGENEWTAFERSLHLMMEKEVIIPFPNLTKGEEFAYFVNCLRVGKVLESAVWELSQEHKSFSPVMNILEPAWASLQTLLQAGDNLWGGSEWLEPDLVATIIVGPVIYTCASKSIVVTVPSHPGQTKEKGLPKYDMRAIANMNYLDKCIVGILKGLNRFNKENREKDMIELLVSPLHALSVSLSIATGLVDKAQSKLCYALAKGKTHSNIPSLFAISGVLWSQLIQIVVTFPGYNAALRYDHTIPALADAVATAHQELVSRVFEFGVVPDNIVLPGDNQITTSLWGTKGPKKTYKAKWENVRRIIYTQHESEKDQTKHAEKLDLIADNYMKEHSCFPETLLVAGEAVTKLRLADCGLRKLPTSFGLRLSNLQVWLLGAVLAVVIKFLTVIFSS